MWDPLILLLNFNPSQLYLWSTIENISSNYTDYIIVYLLYPSTVISETRGHLWDEKGCWRVRAKKLQFLKMASRGRLQESIPIPILISQQLDIIHSLLWKSKYTLTASIGIKRNLWVST